MSSKKDFRRGKVFVQSIFAGTIEETDEGYRFTYDSDYLRSEHPLPVCIGMPCREERYDSAFLFPFFDGLIPEGWLLDFTARKRK